MSDRDLPSSPDLWGPLTDTPLPPLAPGADVRRRGDQRRARGRALLAGSGAAVVLLGAGATYALSSTPTQLRSAAPAPTPAVTSPSASPSSTPPPPTTTATPSREPSTSPASPVAPPPSPSPSPSASSSPSTVAVPADALVDAADLGRSWLRTASSRSPVAPSLDPCGDGLPAAGTAVAQVSGVYGMRADGRPVPEGPAFRQEVVRYPSPDAAAAAAARLRRTVARCPVADLGYGERSLRVVRQAPFVVETVFRADGESRPQPFRSYAGVAVAGDLLATWTLGDPHGIERAQADEVAGLVRAALCRAGTC